MSTNVLGSKVNYGYKNLQLVANTDCIGSKEDIRYALDTLMTNLRQLKKKIVFLMPVIGLTYHNE